MSMKYLILFCILLSSCNERICPYKVGDCYTSKNFDDSDVGSTILITGVNDYHVQFIQQRYEQFTGIKEEASCYFIELYYKRKMACPK